MFCLLLAQAMGKSHSTAYATSSSLYTQSVQLCGLEQEGSSQTACWERRASVVYLLWQPSAALRSSILFHSAELHKHSSPVQALLGPPCWRLIVQHVLSLPSSRPSTHGSHAEAIFSMLDGCCTEIVLCVHLSGTTVMTC